MKDTIHTYIESLVKERSPFLQELEQYALINSIPIMELAGIETLLQLLRLQCPKKILEIGTAIGYSALRMADALPNVQIISIERDENRYEQAIVNIAKAGYSEQIHVLNGDALEINKMVEAYGPFDGLFIDAAKGQYGKFFELYSPLLTNNGIVYTDNVLFKGLVTQEDIENKRIRSLVNKIKHYNEWLMKHEEFVTTIIPVGDGLAVSKKR